MSPVGTETDTGCSHPPSLPEAPANVLVLAPTMEDASDEMCGDLMTCAPPGETALLAVSLLGTPDSVLDAWRGHSPAQLPARVGIVTCDDMTRSAASSAGNTTTLLNGRVAVTSVNEPSDLTGLGIRMSQCLSNWKGEGNQVVVCFDSLTTLLQYVEVQRAFQFLHVLTKRIASIGGVAHFHMDPGAHDEQTVTTIRSLFDTVLTYEDGAWTAC
jgi:hypothetical protein